MIKKLMGYAGKYKIYAILSPVSIVLEVLIEVIIPLLMSVIIDCGISGQYAERAKVKSAAVQRCKHPCRKSRRGKAAKLRDGIG